LTTRETAPNAVGTLRKGVELELAFTDLLANGQGVGRAAGLVVFCFGPLPDELARARVTEVKQRYAVAEKLAILRESPQRADPFCPVFGRCGGCQIQHLRYAAQLTWKRDVVRETMHRIGGIEDPQVGETIGMTDPRAYRNKMALVVDASTDPPALGFYQQRSHEVVAIDGCPVVAPVLDAMLRRLDALRRTESVRVALREARHLVARASSVTNEGVLTITTARRSEAVVRAAHDLHRDIPGLAGVTNSFDLSNENAILGRRHRVLAGRGEIEEGIGGVRYRVSPGSFFQVNVEMVGRIFEALEPWLDRSYRIVDLYCGVGTFSLFFAKRGCRVHGVEENAGAVAEAVANARLNELQESTRFATGRVERLIESPAFRRALRKSDVVFLDPPRKGCDEMTLAHIADARVRHIWYLSCDPATLARDSKFLVAKGYRLDSLQPFDMFPQTGHVETLARLEYS
jgi:23S rRNA (uracil1939-C5)-methyltransferase